MALLIGSPILTIAQPSANGVNAATWDWVRKGSGCSYDRTNSLSNNTCGFIYSVGSFHDTAHFTNSAGVASKHLKSHGGRDGFLAKYTEDGKLIWTAVMGGTLEDETWDVNSSCSAVYVTGYFQGTMTLESAAGSGGVAKHSYRPARKTSSPPNTT